MDNELQHHGILGMKWGVRRYQNKDGSLTTAGRKRYSSGESKKKNSDWVDKGYFNSPSVVDALSDAHSIFRGLGGLSEKTKKQNRYNESAANGVYPRVSQENANAYNSINSAVDHFIQDTLDEEWDSYASNYRRKETDSLVESALRRIGNLSYDSLFNASDVRVSDEFLTPNAKEYIRNIGRKWV